MDFLRKLGPKRSLRKHFCCLCRPCCTVCEREWLFLVWERARPFSTSSQGTHCVHAEPFRLARPSNRRGKRQWWKRGRTTCMFYHSGLQFLSRAERATEPLESISNWHSSAFPSPRRPGLGCGSRLSLTGQPAALPAMARPLAGRRAPGGQPKEPAGLVRRAPRLCPLRGAHWRAPGSPGAKGEVWNLPLIASSLPGPPGAASPAARCHWNSL